MQRRQPEGRPAVAAEIPAKPLAEEAPLYSREAKPPQRTPAVDLEALPKIDNHQALRQLLRDPNIASKNWVYRQYDHTVRTGTMVKPGSDAAVFFVRYANKILAATSDCNSLYCGLDPREGAKVAVAEAARNLTCSGAEPLAVTDNLNFGNPYKPENFWQLREAVEGAAEACRVFGTPVTGGNVSLYNESPAGGVDPTPTIGMVGLIEKEEHITTQWFKNEGDEIILVGKIGDELGGSRFLKVCHGKKIGPPPHVDLAHEIKIQSAVRDLIRAGVVKSAHDCSEGGLAVAIAECCFNPKQRFGAEIRISAAETEAVTTLFNESQSRIVISVAPENLEKTMSILKKAGVSFQRLGKVGGDQLGIQVADQKFAWLIADLYDDWWNSIRRLVQSDTCAEGIPSL